jgi:uncharacterized membrane protein YccC
MQRVSLGEPWWAAKKKELYTRAQAERDAAAREKAEKDKKLEKMRQMKGKRKMGALEAISMDMRVRERMGKWRYTFMPWRRNLVVEELERMDEMLAQLEG